MRLCFVSLLIALLFQCLNVLGANFNPSERVYFQGNGYVTLDVNDPEGAYVVIERDGIPQETIYNLGKGNEQLPPNSPFPSIYWSDLHPLAPAGYFYKLRYFDAEDNLLSDELISIERDAINGTLIDSEHLVDSTFTLDGGSYDFYFVFLTEGTTFKAINQAELRVVGEVSEILCDSDSGTIFFEDITITSSNEIQSDIRLNFGSSFKMIDCSSEVKLRIRDQGFRSNTKDIVISGNTFTDGVDIRINHSEDVLIENNVIPNGTEEQGMDPPSISIRAEGISQMTITGNTLPMIRGSFTVEGTDLVVEDNDFIYREFFGPPMPPEEGHIIANGLSFARNTFVQFQHPDADPNFQEPVLIESSFTIRGSNMTIEENTFVLNPYHDMYEILEPGPAFMIEVSSPGDTSVQSNQIASPHQYAMHIIDSRTATEDKLMISENRLQGTEGSLRLDGDLYFSTIKDNYFGSFLKDPSTIGLILVDSNALVEGNTFSTGTGLEYAESSVFPKTLEVRGNLFETASTLPQTASTALKVKVQTSATITMKDNFLYQSLVPFSLNEANGGGKIHFYNNAIYSSPIPSSQDRAAQLNSNGSMSIDFQNPSSSMENGYINIAGDSVRGGNVWSGYDGLDNDQNGLGDNPYDLFELGLLADSSPLVSPLSEEENLLHLIHGQISLGQGLVEREGQLELTLLIANEGEEERLFPIAGNLITEGLFSTGDDLSIAAGQTKAIPLDFRPEFNFSVPTAAQGLIYSKRYAQIPLPFEVAGQWDEADRDSRNPSILETHLPQTYKISREWSYQTPIGFLFATESSWNPDRFVFHSEHQWLYLPDDLANVTNPLYVFDQEMGWMAFFLHTYPIVYLFESNTFARYEIGSEPRQFTALTNNSSE